MFNSAIIWTILGMGTAQAEWKGGAANDTAIPTLVVGTPDENELERAATIPEMTGAQVDWLRPRRKKMEQNPFSQTDFTAYSLEWGETKVGLANVTVGVLPRTQLGTVPALDVLGVPNINAKLNFFRLGPVDMAVSGHRFQLSAGDFSASQSGLGAITSIQITRPWSIHFGAHYQVLQADGLPDFGQLSPLLLDTTGIDVSPATLQEVQEHVDLHFQARRVTAQVATDIRLNRRDSIILRGDATVWREIDTGIESDLPPILGLNDVFDESGEVAIQDAYTASASWQFAWKRAELRIGAGVSSVPGAWLLQSTEFSYRFGGKTRNLERHMRSGWRQDKRNLRQAQRSGRDSADQPS